ncbi:MAG TPA: PilW family protein [Burkholderiales bacterium]|nr:PilW family protein [Burkholderiales bacterium]
MNRYLVKRASGMSLVELMISMALGLMIFAGVITVFANASRSRAEISRASVQIENGRVAVDTLTEDLRLAGYYGELDTSGLPVPAAVPDPCATAPAAWEQAIPIHIQGYESGAGAPPCFPPGVKPGTDMIVVRRARACIAGTARCEPVAAGEPYLQVNLCTDTPATHAIAPAGSPALTHTLKDCTTAAGLRRYVVHTYFVGYDNGSGAAVPTLKRLEFDGAGMIEVPLVEGIERLELRYGIDHDGNGAPDAYVADPALYTYAGCTSCSAPNNWANVVAVELHVLSRATEPSPGHVDRKTYELGVSDSGNPIVAGPFNDAYRRHVYTKVVRLMNPSMRREAP